MLMQMNTGKYIKNNFITDRKMLMKFYVKEYFLFEIIPLIFEMFSSEDVFINILLHLPLLLKIKGMAIVLNNLEFYIL